MSENVPERCPDCNSHIMYTQYGVTIYECGMAIDYDGTHERTEPNEACLLRKAEAALADSIDCHKRCINTCGEWADKNLKLKARTEELEATVQSIREWASDCEILGEVAPDVFAGNLRIDHEALLSFYNILNEQPKENPDAK